MKTLLGPRLNFDWKIVTITIVSTLLLMVDSYHKLTAYKYLDRVILYLVIPLIIIVILFRENPREYGFTFGDWKAGLIITALGILLMAPVIYYLGHGDASMKAYYKPYLAGLPWTTFLDLIGWEFCRPFRLRWRTSANPKWRRFPPSSVALRLGGSPGARGRFSGRS
jgi:amino acid transporter